MKYYYQCLPRGYLHLCLGAWQEPHTVMPCLHPSSQFCDLRYHQKGCSKLAFGGSLYNMEIRKHCKSELPPPEMVVSCRKSRPSARRTLTSCRGKEDGEEVLPHPRQILHLPAPISRGYLEQLGESLEWIKTHCSPASRWAHPHCPRPS